MRPKYKPLARDIENRLEAFDKKIRLPGIADKDNRSCLIEQLVDSIKRVRYILLIRDQDVGDINISTASQFFDPLKGAVWQKRRGHFDEAFWLVFLATHFGKHRSTGWNLSRIVYGANRSKAFWTWNKIIKDPSLFLDWLNQNQDHLQASGKFGNHRKYESCNAYKSRGTGAAITSYIDWIGEDSHHMAKFEEALVNAGGDQKAAFDDLYYSMNKVVTFGRTAKFDYLTMIGKLGLCEIEPGLAYLSGATGPLRGAKLLFGNSTEADFTPNQLEEWLRELEKSLGQFYGMQVLEDALCNWQKSPSQFEHFIG